MSTPQGQPVLVRPLRFGPAVEVWEARLRGRRVLARRFPLEGPPPGWPPPPDPGVLRAMNHPALQRFLGEVRDDEGARIQVFAWREGRTAAEVLRVEGPLSPSRCLAVVRRAASGLKWLHERGPAAPRLHGDPSPANLLLGEAGRCVWLDVQALEPGCLPGGPGVVFGTLAYLAPEVLAGRPPTEASEVFALGVIAARLLGVSLPWAQAVAPSEVLDWQSRVPPASLVPEVPQWPGCVTMTLRAMLSPEPSARPSAGQAMKVFGVGAARQRPFSSSSRICS